MQVKTRRNRQHFSSQIHNKLYPIWVFSQGFHNLPQERRAGLFLQKHSSVLCSGCYTSCFMIAAVTTAGVMEHNVHHIPSLCFQLPGPLNDPAQGTCHWIYKRAQSSIYFIFNNVSLSWIKYTSQEGSPKHCLPCTLDTYMACKSGLSLSACQDEDVWWAKI